MLGKNTIFLGGECCCRAQTLTSSLFRSFYEDLPDLLNTYPPNLLGLTEEQAEQLREEERAKQKERIANASLEGVGEGGLETDGGGGDNDTVVEGMKGLSLEEGGEEGRGDGMGEKDGEWEDGGEEVRFL